MIKSITIVAVLVMGLYFGASYIISSGQMDNFLDGHPEYKWVPAVEYYIGQYHIVMGQWDKAIYRFSRVTEKYPADKYAPRAQFALANAYDQKGNTKTALEEYQKLVELYPGSPNEDVAKKRIAVLR